MRPAVLPILYLLTISIEYLPANRYLDSILISRWAGVIYSRHVFGVLVITGSEMLHRSVQ